MSKPTWGYTESNGPAKWNELFPIANGDRQSPIDIQTSGAVHDEKLEGDGPLTLNYVPEQSLAMTNTGHSVTISIQQQSELSGGPLDGKYRLAQFHLHWGSQKESGSEHTIDGKTFSAELHLVHWNTKYAGFKEAVEKPDGLAVLGIMIEEDENKGNDAFKPVSDNLENVKASGSEFTANTTLNPADLLPGSRNEYWTYLGSLTTPPLFESVTWIVFKEPVKYSKEQLDQLRSLVSCHDEALKDNYRPPAPLKGRTVSRSFV